MKRTSYSRFLARAAVTLLAVLFSFTGARAQETLTVHDGTVTNSYVPFYGLWVDSYTRSEVVYPASELDIMAGGTINSITFYKSAGSSSTSSWGAATFKIYMMEVSSTTLSAYEDITDAAVVYEGSIDASGGEREVTITFDTPYDYNGGNLLFSVHQTTKGTYSSAYWFGETVSDALSAGGYNSSSAASAAYNPQNFIPKTTFTYEPSNSSCATPSNFVASDVTAHSATLTWESEAGLYILEYKKVSETDWTALEDINDVKTYTITDLDENTAYIARVKAVCNPDAEPIVESGWRTVNFTTLVSCPAPTDLAVTLTPGNGKVATLAWTENGNPAATSWQICLNDDEENLIAAATNPFQLTGLTPETAYTAKVRAVGNGEFSSWTDNITFTPTDAYILIVNDGTATNEYVPFYGYYADATQQDQMIYPASELTALVGKSITEMKFFIASKSGTGDIGNWIVSIGEIEATSLSDLDNTTTLQEVYSGAMNFNSDETEMTVTFDNEYFYQGGNLLVEFNHPVKSGYKRYYFYGENVTGASYSYGSQRNFLPKTAFAFGEAPTVLKPFGLAVNYTEGVTAEVSWTQKDDAKEWIVAYKAEDDEEFTEVTVTNTPQHTLSGLELGTTYEVKVCAKIGSDVSEWAGPVTFTTDACMPEDLIVVNYTLNDSYGDGWNGNYILVVDEDCNVIESLTISNGNSATGTVKLCGKVAQFMWYNGNYPDETSWSFTDADGNVLFEGAGNDDMQTYDLLYSIDKNPYSMPTDITVSEVGPHTATVSWTETGTATAWQIGFYNDEGAIDNIVDADSNPFTLTGLDPETDYYVVVRAVGAEGESNWPCLGVDFTTAIAAPAPTELAASEITATSALISWNGFGESYDLRYMALPDSKGFAATSNAQPKTASRDLTGLFASAPKSFANTNIRNINAKSIAKAKAKNSRDGWYYYDNDTYSSSIGTGGSEIYWGIMLPAGMTSESQLTKISVYEDSEGNNDEPITLYVYAGGDTPNEGTLLYEEEFDTEAADDWHEVTLTTPVEINPFQNLWIVLKEYGAYPASGCSVSPGDANGRWISLDGADWMDIADANLNYTWMIRAYLEGTYELPGEWIEVSGINASEYELTGLDPETNYTVQVRGNFGEDGQSNWAGAINFTTGSLLDAPSYLKATELTSTSTTLKWTGSQESYNVQYRKSLADPTAPATIILTAPDIWGDGSGYQMLLDADATAYGTIIPTSGGLTSSGDASDVIYDEFEFKIPGNADGALSTENIVMNNSVAIEIPAGTYDWCITNPTPGDRVWIASSNGVGGRYDDFVFEPGVTYEFTIAMYGSNDGVDLTETRPMGDWTTVENVTNPYELTNLTPNTYYEWQVQGIYEGGTTEWVSGDNFTTLPLIELVDNDLNATEKNSDIIGANDTQVADVKLKGRTLYTEVWNTLCLPFNLTLAGSPLEGATVKTLQETEENGDVILLKFGEQSVTEMAAGKPYIVKLAGNENIAEPVFTGVTINATDDHAVTSGDVQFIGYYNTLRLWPNGSGDFDAADVPNIYYMKSNSTLYHTEQARLLSPLRAYFKIAASTKGRIVLDFGDGEVTGISDINSDTTSNGDWYNVNGMKLNQQPSRKGLYIQNGRKVVIK